MSGLEPMTPCMSSRYSNQLSYTLTTETIIAYLFRFVNPLFQIFLKSRKKGGTGAENPVPRCICIGSYQPKRLEVCSVRSQSTAKELNSEFVIRCPSRIPNSSPVFRSAFSHA